MDDWFSGSGNGTPIDVAAIFDSEASRLFGELVSAGALVSLGLTSDGGALGITITVDGAWRRDYFRDSELLVDWLDAAVEPVGRACELAKAARASAVPRRRSRGL